VAVKIIEPILTQEVMGSDGKVSGGGGGAYRLVKSRSLNFLPISDRALSTCCCAPRDRSKHKSRVYQLSLDQQENESRV